MEIELRSVNGKRTISCTEFVVRDCYGDPIAVFAEPDPGHIVFVHREQPEFLSTLHALGIATRDLVTYSTEQSNLVRPKGKLILPSS